MKTVVDGRLRLEAAVFDLRYACEHCAHFDSPSGECSQGFPNDEHRRRLLESTASLTFCKSFELG
ncbi:MAG TPA: hypothetical protein VHC69_11125 [Polyangiaceae bacterium]|nr:hypothetical protein [Polyangiaceae bacterium]